MTLATLKGMNFNIGDVANALKLKAADSVYSGVKSVTERAASTAKTISDVATGHKSSSKESKAPKATSAVAGLVDPLNLWGSLTQQFQQIAANAMKEATTKTAVDVTKNMASGLAKEAVKSAKATAKRSASGARSAAKKASSSR